MLERPSGNSGDGNHRVYAADIGNDSKGPKFAESSLILGPEWSRLQFPQPLRAQHRMNMPESLLLSRLATVTYPTTIAEALC